MLVLASASPRRKELLAQAGYSFEVAASGIPEVRQEKESAIAFVTRLAREKAEDIAHRIPYADSSAIVIGADTVVVCDEEILGKPSDPDDARRMLRLLSGRTHQVITGVCVVHGACIECAAEVTMVTMLTLGDAEIDAYVATGDPMDKAGAYAIQGAAGKWVPRIHGCYFNVVGLPLALVNAMIQGALARSDRS